LWGILGLVFSQPEPSVNFYATRNFILRQLGSVVGGENYTLFEASLRRLAGVRYSNDRFFDPVRGEHRQVAFGFLSFSIPTDHNSQRAWHIGIDPIFYSLVEPIQAHFWFDLETYRSLDAASRRLFLLLKKIFHRSSQSPRWELRHLASDILGYSALEPKFLKRKVKVCADRLWAIGAVDATNGMFDRQGKTTYVQFHRGPYFDEEVRTPRVLLLKELPIFDQWVAIGVDEEGMQYLKRNFPMDLLQQWADITLAARERHGTKFFDRSMAAYYIDNVKAAKKDGRSPPDWWHEFKKQELYAVKSVESESTDRLAQPGRREYLKWLKTDGRRMHEETLARLLEEVALHGRVSRVEAAAARQKADLTLWNEFLSRYFLTRKCN
jgi:hypothetical protein